MKQRLKIVAILVALLVVVATFVTVNNHEPSGYMVRVVMADAGGLESGSNVNVAGATVGRVNSLTVNRAGRAVAMLVLNKNAAPIGTTASASVEIDGFFGERLVDLSRGDFASHPERSGSTISESHSSVSVRLDDVLDALNMSAQGALQTFLDESGTALVGRSQDLRAVLQQLPQTLPQLTSLLDEFSSNQQALGQLVDRSDQVVSQIAPQRRYLASLINSANSALGALASRRDQLGSTVQRAPATLQQAQTTLAKLQGTAIPLAPAADGLKATAPSLLTALKEVPSFTKAAVPTLNEVSNVAPALDRLAAYGTPIVKQIVPLANELTTYTGSALSPLFEMLADHGGAENLIGLMEGWARSTQGYDASGHIFRFGAAVEPSSFTQLLSSLNVPATTSAPTPAKAPAASTQPSTPLSTPAAGLSGVSTVVSNVGSGVASTVNKVVGGLTGTVNKVTSGLSGAASKLGGRSSTTAGSTTTNAQGLSSLLGYLTGK